MATVALEIGTTSLPLATNQVLANWHFHIEDKTGAQAPIDVEFDVPKAVLELTPGEYTATAWRLDNTGAQFGDKATADITIPVLAMGEAAATLTVTLA